MTEKIRKCTKCGLCFNQKPILDVEKKCEIFWVGLSAKKVESDTELPLSADTNTGMLIRKVEEACGEISAYKTNLVKCLPLNNEQKLRYPNQKEMDCCFENLLSEINIMSPRIVFLLGEKVYSTVERKLKIKLKKWRGFEYYYEKVEDVYYVPIQHPSYIYVYKRKEMQNYITGIEKVIKQLL